MVSLRSEGDSGAVFDISGVVPTGATWGEDIYFSEDGAPLDISIYSEWRITLRCDPASTAADVKISTADGSGYLAVADDENGNHRILRIHAPADFLSGYAGKDYIIDLASKDADGNVKLWGHGVVSLPPNPPTFS